MKKIYLSMFAMGLFAMGSNAQLVQKTTQPHKPAPFKKTISPALNTTSLQKSNFWTEDFNVTATGAGTFTTANGVWTTGGANADVWKHTFTTSNGEFSGTPTAIGTTTGANGAMIYDVDSVNFPSSPNYSNYSGELISPVIDLTGEASVSLTLEQDFRYCCQGSLDINVSVSSDNGANWSAPYNLSGTTGANNDYFTDNGNSYAAQANITADAAGNNVMLKFTWEGVGSNNSHYFWIIDDICLTATATNDIIAQLPRWGTTGSWGTMLPYFQVPVDQIQPVDFSAYAFNNGQAVQNNVQLNVDANGGAFTASSPGIVVQPGSSDTLALGAQYTPAATVASNAVVWGVTQTETDENPTDNDLSGFSIDVTNNIYARDGGVIDGGTFNGGDGFESGNIFDIFTADNIYGIDVTIGTQANAGSFIQTKLYEIDAAGDFIQVDASAYYTVTAADLGSNITLPLLSASAGGYPLNAGSSYLVVVASDGDGGATNDLVVATSGESEPQTTFYWDATQSTWFYSTSTPMVRMNFDNTLTVEEPSQVYGVNLFPNPSTDAVNISYNLVNSSEVSIEVVDITGKVITSVNEGTKVEGKHIVSLNTDAFANGIYYVNVTSNNTVVTEKLIKK
ncbi:MAG: T9SS type A sorting domain-containing protein [Crocinitomicaceae bacterium]|nr:T9SS type A sorting domain-containing protein [Crocinitomicaceae bacterium]